MRGNRIESGVCDTDGGHGTGRKLLGPNWERNEHQRAVAKVLEEVAASVGAPNIQAGEDPLFALLRPHAQG